MKISRRCLDGMTLVEGMISTVLIGVFGLVIFSLLNIGTVLGAKNSAVNVTHQSARMAMLKVTQDLRSAVSLPSQVRENNGKLEAVAAPSPAPGVAFQLWGKDLTGKDLPPFRITSDATVGQNKIKIAATTTTQPRVGQWLIVPTHEIEDEITAVSGTTTCTVTLANNLVTAIDVPNQQADGSVTCFVTDRCAYAVVNNELRSDSDHDGDLDGKDKNGTANGSDKSIEKNITNPTPFKIDPTLPQRVEVESLSTSDAKTGNRKFKAVSANIILDGQVSTRARLTTYQ